MSTAFAFLSGPPLDPDSVAAAIAGRRCRVFELAGGRLIAAESVTVQTFPAGDGVLVGHARDAASSSVDLARAGVASAVIGSDGAFPIGRWRGSFGLLWRHRLSQQWCVLRDPSGAVPIFLGRTDRADIAFSDLRLACDLGLLAPRIDWSGVAHALTYNQLPGPRTAMAEVREVVAGTTACLDGSLDRVLWSPWQSLGNDTDPVAAAAAVRQAVEEAVQDALNPLGGSPALALELSGGLDSSIIAACLGEAGRPWRGLNLYTAAADGDERHYAALVAGRCGGMIEAVPAEALDLLAPLRHVTPRPSGHGFLSGLDQVLDKAADHVSASAVLSGAGGDHVFAALGGAVPVVDAWRRGTAGGAFRTLQNVAALQERPVWNVARDALRVAVGPDQPWLTDRSFLADRAIEAPAHPWIAGPRGSLPGARARVRLLMRAHSLIGTHPRAERRPFLCPLMASSVIDACLAAPSWMWVAGGHDRALARAAFADRLPPEIVWRRSKGRLESLIVPAVERQRAAIRTALLDGTLAGAGLLDRNAVARATARLPDWRHPAYSRLLALLDAELWARAVLALPARAH